MTTDGTFCLCIATNKQKTSTIEREKVAERIAKEFMVEKIWKLLYISKLTQLTIIIIIINMYSTD